MSVKQETSIPSEKLVQCPVSFMSYKEKMPSRGFVQSKLKNIDLVGGTDKDNPK